MLPSAVAPTPAARASTADASTTEAWAAAATPAPVAAGGQGSAAEGADGGRWRAVALLGLWGPIAVGYGAMARWTYRRPPLVALGNTLAAIVPGLLLAHLGGRLSARLGWPEPGASRRAWARHAGAHLALGYALSGAWLAWLWVRLALEADVATAATFWGRWWAWQLHAGVWPMLLAAFLGHAARGTRLLQVRREAAAQAERARVTAELGALRAHLSPHFLFNTLHGVGASVRADPAAAAATLDRLDDLLRYVLRHAGAEAPDGASAVTLGDEWRFVADYLALERERLGERLRWTARLDDGALALRVPPFLLQPLVENAVRHAVAPLLTGGTITVTAERRADGALVVRVADDGPGADPAALRATPGLGLRAVRERVAALGAGAACTVRTAPGEGFAVEAVLPAGRVTSAAGAPPTRRSAARASGARPTSGARRALPVDRTPVGPAAAVRDEGAC